MSDGTEKPTPIDRAYDNSTYIPNASSFSAGWAEAAERFRKTTRSELDVAYGVGPRERYDLFLPEGSPRALAVFIHGGYWMAFDKSTWSHLSAGALAHGYAVLVPSYPLCPSVRLADISRAIASAVSHAAERVDGPIVISGHSAGGHLATRMACLEGPLPSAVQERLERVVTISGLHDLRPLLETRMNETLRLDATEARRESPALADPAPVDLVAWVGDGERPQLRRQTRLIATIWDGLARSVRHVEAADRHHFDVIQDLAEPDSPLVAAMIGEPTL